MFGLTISGQRLVRCLLGFVQIVGIDDGDRIPLGAVNLINVVVGVDHHLVGRHFVTLRWKSQLGFTNSVES